MRKVRMDDDAREAAADRAAKAADRKAKQEESDDEPVFRTDDDDLDGAQNNKKGAVRAGKGKKKLPLAGGRKLVDPPAPIAPPPDHKAQDKWGNAGWQARFKQKMPGAGAAAAAHDDEARFVSVSPPLRPTLADDDLPRSSLPPAPELDHPLVARYAAFDLSRAAALADSDEDDFQANPQARKSEEDTPMTHNLTICALIPGESRFLPEWLLYHRLLGADHFVLYDTSAGAAVGGELLVQLIVSPGADPLFSYPTAAEVDGLADRMEAEGKGELGPTAEEIKAGVARAAADALDEGAPRRSAAVCASLTFLLPQTD